MKVKMNKSELNDYHANYIGASEVPILFGEGYITYEELIKQKVLREVKEPNVRMKIGSALEKILFQEEVLPYLAGRYKKVWHNDYDVCFLDYTSKIVAIPDIVAEDDEIVLVGDIKTTSRDNAKAIKYHLQVQTQMMLSGAPIGLIAVYNFMQGAMDYEIVWKDELLHNEIKDKVKKFWEDFNLYLTNTILPEPESEETTEETPPTIAPDDVLDDCLTYNALAKNIKELTAKKDEIQKRIKEKMILLNADKLADSNNQTIAKIVRRQIETLDKNKIKLALMDKYKDYVKITTTEYVKIGNCDE